ncbi:hypothetical protein C8034_v007691 [Colletotrichum sidae]|uniref:Uncharacterized protein n=1 Tax=Colletotrichum sidae TaxID=1347389 RepID=A0A4R8T394_9PEZI|nr:hypothetical protein C8034_v007691 [Colletotrichum sidae]
MQISRFVALSLVAVLPAVQADDGWVALDCWVADVTVDGKLVDQDRSLKYDWQLTKQVCDITYARDIAQYDPGSGRCVVMRANSLLSGDRWWKNCQQQAANGWYDVDRTTNTVVKNHDPYKSNRAEGRGYNSR